MGQAAIFETRGNDDCVILRGGKQTNTPKVDRGRHLRAQLRPPACAVMTDVRTPTAASSTSARRIYLRPPVCGQPAHQGD
jgi:phospho-2-dehydro-3-deoxyheptonate aldolase